MGAADKIPRMYTFNGANLVTCAATGTLLVVDGGKVVFHLDGSFGAGFFTFSASDAAVRADFTHLRALIVAGALHYHAGGVVDKADDAVGAFLDTKTAADTFSRVDLRDAFRGIDAYGISRAHLYTVAVAEAGKCAIAVARIGHICRKTGLGTVVDVFSLRGEAGAVAGNIGNLLNYVGCLKAHDLSDLLRNSVTAGTTEGGVVGDTVGKSLGISVTA